MELTDRERYFLTAARRQENRCENYSALPGAWTEPAEPAWFIFARTTGIRCIHCAEDGLYCPVAITAGRPL